MDNLSPVLQLGPVYTNCQRKYSVNVAMMLVAQFQLTTMELLQNGLQPHFKQLHCGQWAVSQASMQCQCYIFWRLVKTWRFLTYPLSTSCQKLGACEWVRSTAHRSYLDSAKKYLRMLWTCWTYLPPRSKHNEKKWIYWAIILIEIVVHKYNPPDVNDLLIKDTQTFFFVKSIFYLHTIYSQNALL